MFAKSLPACVLATSIIAARFASAHMALDLDGDGKPDSVILYQGRAAFTVVVRFAGAAHAPERFHFVVDPQREDAVCRLPVRLVKEHGSGFRVEDGACDSIHFFWNRTARQLHWWRL